MNNQDLNIILAELSTLSNELLNRFEYYSKVDKQRMLALGCNVVPVKDERAVGDYAKLEVGAIKVAQKLIDTAGTLLWHSVYDEKKRKNLCDVLEELSFKAYQAIQQAKDGGNG